MKKKYSPARLLLTLLCLALTLGSFALVLNAQREEYTPVEWEMDENAEYIYGGDKRYERYYAKGAFYKDARVEFCFSNGVSFDGRFCTVYGDSAYPQIVSVSLNNGYSYVFVDERGKEILDSFIDRSSCIYYLEKVGKSHAVISGELISELDRKYNRTAKLTQADVRDLGEAEILEITGHDSTESKAYQHGALYYMADGTCYYVCYEELNNTYFDADGFFSYRQGFVDAYPLDLTEREEIELARGDMKFTEHTLIYENDVISGYCDIYGNTIDKTDDPGYRVTGIVLFYLAIFLVGIALPAVLLVLSLKMAGSRRTGEAKCWYALTVTSSLWMLSALLLVIASAV